MLMLIFRGQQVKEKGLICEVRKKPWYVGRVKDVCLKTMYDNVFLNLENPCEVLQGV